MSGLAFAMRAGGAGNCKGLRRNHNPPDRTQYNSRVWSLTTCGATYMSMRLLNGSDTSLSAGAADIGLLGVVCAEHRTQIQNSSCTCHCYGP